MADLELYRKDLSKAPVKTRKFKLRGGKEVTLTFNRVGDVDVFQGDIILPPLPTIIPYMGGILLESTVGALWPGGVIPYIIDKDAVNVDNINEAIQFLNESTGLRLIPRANQNDFVVFVRSEGCSSHIGKQSGPQNIWIANWANSWNVVHEIMHAAGVFHEHCRLDRDNYVTINWGNIAEESRHNFDKIDESWGYDINSYDYNSVMHYGRNSFGNNTIVPKNPNANIGQRERLSELDQLGLQVLYDQNFDPVTDITMISGNNNKITAPPGFMKMPQDLNQGAGGKYIYLCYKKTVGGSAITDLAVISGSSSGIAAPSGFTKIPQDLNQGAGGKYIYLCYKKSASGTPITNIMLISGNKKDIQYKNAFGYTILPNDLNEGAGGKYIYLCYSKYSRTCIGDVTVIAGKNKQIQPPSGFKRVDTDLNAGAGGDYIYLCYKPGTLGQTGVCGLEVIIGKSQHIAASPGYEKINVDLNKGAGGQYIYLCKKLGEPAIAEVGITSGKNSPPPKDWVKINVDLNAGAGGDYIYLCYRP